MFRKCDRWDEFRYDRADDKSNQIFCVSVLRLEFRLFFCSPLPQLHFLKVFLSCCLAAFLSQLGKGKVRKRFLFFSFAQKDTCGRTRTKSGHVEEGDAKILSPQKFIFPSVVGEKKKKEKSKVINFNRNSLKNDNAVKFVQRIKFQRKRRDRKWITFLVWTSQTEK